MTEGSDIPRTTNQPFASVEQMAGEDQSGTDVLGIAEEIRVALTEGTDLAVDDPGLARGGTLVGPGPVAHLTVMDVNGVEYHLFVQKRLN